jgi:lambda repressor-like predicted transcriptional regulator
MSRKLIVLGTALLAVIVVGAGIAATKALTPKQESQAVIDDAAKQLGVSPDQLSNALKQALKNRVDEAVTDGRLTKAEGDRIKQAIDKGGAPLFGLGPRRFHDHGQFGFRRHGHGPFEEGLETAASYLGITRAQLMSELREGKSLAQVAKAHGKSADGLVNALLDRAEQKLDRAVKNGRMTEAEKKEMLAGLKKRITDLVNGRFPAPPRFHRFGGDGRPVPEPPVFGPRFS